LLFIERELYETYKNGCAKCRDVNVKVKAVVLCDYSCLDGQKFSSGLTESTLF